jgi:uncharacterized heparinase superfamily protein
MRILDKFRTIKASFVRGYRTLKGKLYSGVSSVSSFNSYVPERLLIAPHDLRTADPIIAQEFYSGHYSLGGITIDAQGKSPFIIKAENQAWEKELHGFGWLRHFTANQDTLSDSHARALVRDWIELSSSYSSIYTWEIETASKRLMSFLKHSIVLLSNADADFHYLFMRSLGRHVREIKRLISTAPEGMPVLCGHIALGYASICFTGNSGSIFTDTRKFESALRTQILGDGGHISRNPAILPELLAELLPLKQGYEAVDLAPPAELVNAIERLLPALRFFRHGDGTISRFNGSGVTKKDLVATLIRYDENLGTPVRDAVHSGYQRVAIGNSSLIMDTGTPPLGELSVTAAAGALSFEFSNGMSTLVVNCGTPAKYESNTSQVWRTTNAHSTAILNNASFARFENPETVSSPLSGQLFTNNMKLEYSRQDTDTSSTITAAHEGYVRDFGIRHQRSLTLDRDGERLYGQEWFSGPDKGEIKYTTRDKVALRFHLHPDVKASLTANGETCLLETRDGEQWRFDCPGFQLELTESIFFADLPAPRTTWQIVINTKAYDNPEINWALQKILAT